MLFFVIEIDQLKFKMIKFYFLQFLRNKLITQL